MTRVPIVKTVLKYGVFSCLYLPVFSPNTGKNRPEKLRIWKHGTLWLQKTKEQLVTPARTIFLSFLN